MATIVDREQDEFVRDLAISELEGLHNNIKEFLRKHMTEDENQVKETVKQLLQEDRENVKDK